MISFKKISATIKKKFQSKQSKVTLLILFLALLSRVLLLKSVPISFHPDEKIYAVNAKSLWLSGTNLKGDWKFWQLQPLTPMHAELPTPIMSLGFIFSKDNLLAARIVSIIFSTTLPLILALISEQLFKKKSFFYSTLILASFNPWIWQFGRMSFDILYGLWFYFLAFLLILKNKNYQKLWAIPLIFIGFFQYQGFKLILVPVFALILLYQLWEQFKTKKSAKSVSSPTLSNKHLESKIYLILLGFIGALFAFYLFVKLPSQSALDRVTGRSILSKDYFSLLSTTADLERKRTLPSPFLNLFSNKATVFITKQWQQFFKIFNPQHLFVDGDAALSGFSVWSKGTFYLADFIVLLLFLILPFANKKEDAPKLGLLLALFLLGSLPAFINISNDWFTFRPSFSFTILIMLIAYASALIFEQYQKIFVLLSVVYLFSLINFSYDYFYRYPIYSANGVYFHEKILSSYLARNNNRNILVYSNRSDSYFEAYLFYNNLVTKTNLENIRNAFKEEDKFQFQNITFANVQCAPVNNDQDLILKDPDIPFCEDNQLKRLTIASLEDSGEMIQIYQDKLCNQYQDDLNHYLRYTNLKDFNFGRLNDQNFCLKWITDLGKVGI